MQDIITFGETVRMVLDEANKGASLEEVRKVLADTYPAVTHAHGEILTQADGSKHYRFTEKAGQKG